MRLMRWGVEGCYCTVEGGFGRGKLIFWINVRILHACFNTGCGERDKMG